MSPRTLPGPEAMQADPRAGNLLWLVTQLTTEGTEELAPPQIDAASNDLEPPDGPGVES